MGITWDYRCRGCGYQAEVDEGAGFVVQRELRLCRTTNDLVGVIVSVHSRRKGEEPPDLPIGRCDDCGSEDLREPARAGILRHPMLPAMRRNNGALGDWALGLSGCSPSLRLSGSSWNFETAIL